MNSVEIREQILEPGSVGIVVRCMGCDEDVDSKDMRNGKCLECRVGEVSKPHFDRYLMLCRKRDKLVKLGKPAATYNRRGEVVGGAEDQIGRELRRTFTAIKATLPGDTRSPATHKRAQEFMSRFLQHAHLALGYIQQSEVLPAAELAKGLERLRQQEEARTATPAPPVGPMAPDMGYASGPPS